MLLSTSVSHRTFLLICAVIWPIMGATVEVGPDKASKAPLFPQHLPELEWSEFAAEGFSSPVAGILYSAQKAPTCGVPLGGISTGCLDIEAGGVLGFNSMFI